MHSPFAENGVGRFAKNLRPVGLGGQLPRSFDRASQVVRQFVAISVEWIQLSGYQLLSRSAARA